MELSASSPKNIDPVLFDFLEKAYPKITTAFKLSQTDFDKNANAYETYKENASLAKDGLLSFITSFLAEFFSAGYGIEMSPIDGKKTKESINDLPNKSVAYVPKKMIQSYNEYRGTLSGDLRVVGYNLDVVATLRSAFCSSLPFLLRSFVEDGKGVIGNYVAIREKVNRAMEHIKEICAESSKTNQ